MKGHVLSGGGPGAGVGPLEHQERSRETLQVSEHEGRGSWREGLGGL